MPTYEMEQDIGSMKHGERRIYTHDYGDGGRFEVHYHSEPAMGDDNRPAEGYTTGTFTVKSPNATRTFRHTPHGPTLMGAKPYAARQARDYIMDQISDAKYKHLRNPPKESSVSVSRHSLHTEAEILNAMAFATLDEQKALTEELLRVRSTKRAQRQAEADLDLSDSYVRDVLSPVAVHELNTTATDWLSSDYDDTPSLDPAEVDHTMRAAATMWFKRLSPEVRESKEEVGIQAQGQAIRLAGQFGELAPSARAAYYETIERLYAQSLQHQADLPEAEEVKTPEPGTQFPWGTEVLPQSMYDEAVEGDPGEQDEPPTTASRRVIADSPENEEVKQLEPGTDWPWGTEVIPTVGPVTPAGGEVAGQGAVQQQARRYLANDADPTSTLNKDREEKAIADSEKDRVQTPVEGEHSGSRHTADEWNTREQSGHGESSLPDTPPIDQQGDTLNEVEDVGGWADAQTHALVPSTRPSEAHEGAVAQILDFVTSTAPRARVATSMAPVLCAALAVEMPTLTAAQVEQAVASYQKKAVPKQSTRHTAQDDDEYYSRCPACGDPIDYCQGHGPSGDPTGHRILEQHDNGNHTDCHPLGCDEHPDHESVTEDYKRRYSSFQRVAADPEMQQLFQHYDNQIKNLHERGATGKAQPPTLPCKHCGSDASFDKIYASWPEPHANYQCSSCHKETHYRPRAATEAALHQGDADSRHSEESRSDWTQSGEGESSLPFGIEPGGPRDQEPMWPWSTELDPGIPGASNPPRDAADVAEVPTPGAGTMGAPQPTASIHEAAKCRRCGKVMNPVDAMVGSGPNNDQKPICGKCVREMHKQVAGNLDTFRATVQANLAKEQS